MSSEFKSAHSGAFEFKVFEEVSYHQCEIHCTAEKAQIFSDIGMLRELFEVIPHFVEKHPDFWLKINQRDVAKGAYGAEYKVDILLHNENLTLIPKSEQVQTVRCYAFRDGKRLNIPCNQIGTKLTYYSNLSGQNAWWARQHVNLLAIVHLTSHLETSFDENSYRIDQFEYQLNNLNISLQVAVSRAISLTPFQYSDCLCQKEVLYRQHGDNIEAQNQIDQLYFINQKIKTDLELERIKGQSIEDLSSVHHLLNQGTKMEYNNYVSSGEIIPLSTLEGSLDFQLSADNSSLWNKFVTAVNLGEHIKKSPPKAILAPTMGARESSPQAVVAAGMTAVLAKKLAIQAVAVGIPYLAENSNEILSKILAQTGARMFKSRSLDKPKLDNQLNIYIFLISSKTLMSNFHQKG